MRLLWQCICAQVFLSSLGYTGQLFCHCLSTGATPFAASGVTDAKYNNNSSSSSSNSNNILILDHINMNHGKGRHDWLKSFYGEDFLGCAWDPRKAKNLETGRKTLWANLGAHQFHLPEGSPDAQVLDGVITVVHPSPETLLERYNNIRKGESSPSSCLNDSLFHAQMAPEGGETALIVTDPWGSVFRIVPGTNDRDPRGSQPGATSEGLAISDLLIHVPINANLDGIGRFYESILGGEVVAAGADHNDARKSSVQIRMGPFQTLTFLRKESVGVETHVDLREVSGEANHETDHSDGDAATRAAGTSTALGNYGVHISLYVADLPTAYRKARDLGLAYVNTRFSRRAYTLEEAVGDCMFRCLDIVDPLHPEDGPILRLEHEVRSVVKQDGSKYKSCPFDKIPEGCVTL